MVDVTRSLDLPRSATFTVEVKYALFLPEQRCWVFEKLSPGTMPISKYDTGSMYWSPDEIYVPIDLITAARLRLIKPGDDSGIGDEQWAWMKLIGLTGEN